MANKIKVKLILELRDAHMSRNAIASTRGMSKNSVSDVIHLADKMDITYEDVKEMDSEEVYRLFYPDKHADESIFSVPDYNVIHEELKKVGVTLKLLWKEYQDKCSSEQELSIPMGYTKFCEGYKEHTLKNNLTNHLMHKPGVAVEVDWSGPTMSYVNQATGEIIKVYLFVATLPFSQYSYVEPCLDMKQKTWLECHITCTNFFKEFPSG